ncbi:MAG TPA: DUF72 domain-containing protein [Acidimicrobiales bacterium]|nr:DUF72 domain-containing protein [Acidimicrobiales bacterium]
MPFLVGTSGWQYRDWRGAFYPDGLRQADWLSFYAQRFATVEVNNAFYRLPDADVFARWAARTPPDFSVAVKASRYLTHIRRLKEPTEPVNRLLERARSLGPKLGPILLQLPPNLPARLGDLATTLAAFPKSIKVAVEFRHPSWYTEATTAVLAEHDAALCWADSPRRRTPEWRTATWGYLRMHEGRASPRPCYGRQALSSWAKRLADRFKPSEDVYVYFNNDTNACAVANAEELSRLLAP